MAALLLFAVASFLFFLTALAFFKPKYAIFFLLVSRPIIDHFNSLKVLELPILGTNALQGIGIFLPLILIFVSFLKKMDIAQQSVFFFKERLTNYYLFFILACLPALLITTSPVLHLGDWLKFVTFWAICLFAQNFLHSEKDFRQALVWILIGSLYPLAMFFMDMVTGNTVRLGGLVRILGGYYLGDKQEGVIFAADILICFVPAFLFYIVDAKRLWLKGLCLGGFIFLLLCIAATNFRTSIAAALMMCICFLLFRKKYTMVLVMVAATICAFLVVPALRGKFAPTLAMIQNMGDLVSPLPTVHDPLLSTRFGIYRTLITTVLYKFTPVTLIAGYGYALPLKAFWVDSSHMEFMQLFFRYGLPPALLFYGFLLAVVRRGISCREDLLCQAITSFVLGLVIISLMGNPFSNVRVLWYLGVYVAILAQKSMPQPSK